MYFVNAINSVQVSVVFELPESKHGLLYRGCILLSFALAVQHERGPRSSVAQKQKLLRHKTIESSSSSFQPEYACLETFIAKLRSAEPDVNIVSAFNDGASHLCGPDIFSETVARLLFKSVGWIKNLSNYLGICFNDQV